MNETSAINETGKLALVVGAGIGGLTAALALARKGWMVHVLEAAPSLKEVGAGLQLSANAMKVLDALGVAHAIQAGGFEPQALELRLGRSGKSVFRIPLGEKAESRWGAPYLHIHRADLVEALADAVRDTGNAKISFGARVENYSENSDGPVLQLASGEPLTAPLIVGADGIHSVIRTRMLGADTPRFTGNVAWRMTVPMERLTRQPPPTACVWAGKGRHAVTYRLRGGELANFVGVVERQDWTNESWTDQGTRTEALADFAGWDLCLTELINKADEHFRWALFDRAPLERWVDGSVALLGDACHPMLPFQAQGAAMAIEDAWVLADSLSDATDIPSGLAVYQSRRLLRTARMQAASRSNMGVFHRRSTLSRLGTYGPMWMAGQVAPAFVRSRLDWIYGYDVTSKDQ
ncbi:FAD-dependent monooxygenase [Henriciella sp. AS95]|uniref:FAD-dependent monooxygenase n=1 Tax=Henriciella sp. AS95 TaxID=3135782 RepID=UPI00317057F7